MKLEKIIHSVSITAISFFVPTLLLSCGHESEAVTDADYLSECEIVATRDVVHGDTVINCHIDKINTGKTIQVPLSMLIDSLEIIRLDNSDSALTGPGICDLSDNYITVVETMRDAPFKLFARDGRFIAEIGKYGQGPGDYQFRPFGIVIDDSNNRLFIYPSNSQKILEYDMEGNFLTEIPLGFPRTGGHIAVDYKNKRILVAQLYFETSTFVSGPPIWVQDFEGNVQWHTYEPIEKMKAGFSNYPMLFNRDKNNMEIYYNRYEAINDTVFYVDMNSHKVKPLFTATFNGEVPGHRYNDVGKYYMVKSVKWPGQENTAWNSREREVIVDKNSLRGSYCEIYNDLLGGIDLKKEISSYLVTSNGDLTIMIDPGDLADKIDARLRESDLSESDKELLQNLQSSISVDDNSYILHGNFKR